MKDSHYIACKLIITSFVLVVFPTDLLILNIDNLTLPLRYIDKEYKVCQSDRLTALGDKIFCARIRTL